MTGKPTRKPQPVRNERRPINARDPVDGRKAADKKAAYEKKVKETSQKENNRKGKKWWKVWEEMQMMNEVKNPAGAKAAAERRRALARGATPGGAIVPVKKRATQNTMRDLQAIARKRRAARVAAGGKGAEGSSGPHFQQNQSTAITKQKPKTSALRRGINYVAPKVMSAADKLRQKYKDERQAGKGPNRAYGGGPYPKVQKPGKKTNNPQSAAMKRKRQEYLEKQKQQKKANEYKGGFRGGVAKSLGGDLISKDPDVRRKARFERGKAMAVRS